MDRLIAFRATRESAAALQLAAKARGCSVSRLIRDAIDRDIGFAAKPDPARQR